VNIFEFPDSVLFIEALDITGCVLDGKKEDIDLISKHIWEGSRNIFSFFFGDDGCNGMKDILNDWMQESIQSVIFYVPRTTGKEIRASLTKKMRTHTLIEKIEQYIETQVRKNIPDFDLYNLNTTPELEAIFDVNLLKRELDRDSKGDDKKIYMIGLKFNLMSNNRVGFYLNNRPINEESGVIYGESKILKNRLRRGFMTIKADEGVEIDFYDTDKFSCKDYDIGSDLEDFDFQEENLCFELDRTVQHVTLLSNHNEKLIFSLKRNKSYEPQKITSSEDEERYEYESTAPKTERESKIYMNSFFIPRDKGLEGIKLLLINKNGQKIIAGGEYHEGLEHCKVIAELSIELDKKSVVLTNHSNSDLTFINFDNNFWKLDESSGSATSNIDNSGIYTSILLDDTLQDDDDLKTTVGDVEKITTDSNITVKSGETFTFDAREIEFNDSNVSFDETGLLIIYSSFIIAQFKNEFILNRMAYKMSNSGTIIDCFVGRPKGRDFRWGGKIYDTHCDILGRAISSKPVLLKNTPDGMLIESGLDSRYYILQISSLSQKYIIEKGDKPLLIANNELRDLKIDIINKGYTNKPLVEFNIEVN